MSNMQTAIFGELVLGYVQQYDASGWNTGGVDGGADGTFLNVDPAALPDGFLSLGSQAVVSGVNDGASLVVASADPTLPNQPVMKQTGWTQIWNTAGVDGGSDGACYHPIAPAGYTAIGDVFTGGGLPSFDVWCVRTDLVVVVGNNTIWNTAGIDGGSNLTINQGILPEHANSSDKNAFLTVPTSTFISYGDVPTVPPFYMLHLMTPYIPPQTPGFPPPLVDYSDPLQTTNVLPDGEVTLPYSLVGIENGGPNGNDPNWQASNSPFYTLRRAYFYTNIMFLDNNTSKDGTLTYSVMQGITNEASNTYSHSAGITIKAETGVEFLGVGGKVSVAVNYQFTYSSESSRQELSSSTFTPTAIIPSGHAGIIWGGTRVFTLYRADGITTVGGDLIYSIEYYVFDQFPAAKHPHKISQ